MFACRFYFMFIHPFGIYKNMIVLGQRFLKSSMRNDVFYLVQMLKLGLRDKERAQKLQNLISEKRRRSGASSSVL